jgi:hypothetical protein
MKLTKAYPTYSVSLFGDTTDQEAYVAAIVEVESEVDKVELSQYHLQVSSETKCGMVRSEAYLAQNVNQALSRELVLFYQLMTKRRRAKELTGTSLTITEVRLSSPSYQLEPQGEYHVAYLTGSSPETLYSVPE